MRECVTTLEAYPPPPSSPNTLSPAARSLTCEPASSTTLENSSPRMSSGVPGGAGYPPCRCIVSARFSADPFTSTSTSSGPGTGSGTSCTLSTSGPPGSVITTARIKTFTQIRISASQCSTLKKDAVRRRSDRKMCRRIPKDFCSLIKSDTPHDRFLAKACSRNFLGNPLQLHSIVVNL